MMQQRSGVYLVAYLCWLLAASVVVSSTKERHNDQAADVAVILPTYRRPGLLRFALKQLSETTQKNVEVIVVDDSPHSEERVDELTSLLRSGDQRLVYFYSSDRLTIGAKRNLAVGLSTAQVLIQVDDDDLYSVERIQYQIQPLLSGVADVTVLAHHTWVDLQSGNSRTRGVADNCFSVRPEVSPLPHFGTLAFTRELFESQDVRYPDDSSLGEDEQFYRLAEHVGRVMVLDNSADHHVYVRHESAANHVHGNPGNLPLSLFEESSCPVAVQNKLPIIATLIASIEPTGVDRRLQETCECCSNANICLSYESAWSLYGCTFTASCPDVAEFELSLGPCDDCVWGVSCQQKYGSYDGCEISAPTQVPSQSPTPSPLSCQCCSNANMCVPYEDAWSMYGCAYTTPCLDIEALEASLGPCDDCFWGISCQDKYGSYDGCKFAAPTEVPTQAPTPSFLSCQCCSNANNCVPYEKAWSMYGCNLFGPCAIVEEMEQSWGSCDDCFWGISCKEKYGSYDGCSSFVADDSLKCRRRR